MRFRRVNALFALMLIVALGTVGHIGRIHAASPSQHLVGSAWADALARSQTSGWETR